MTNNAKFIKMKKRSIFTLTICFILSVLLLFCSACASPSTKNDDKFSKTENDTAILKNGSFEYGSYTLDDDDFPKISSITGWSSVVAENSADTSRVNSGIIKTTDSAWTELINYLYKDSDFKKYAVAKYGITETEESEIKAKIAQNFTSPGVPTGSEGSKVLMINNYAKYNEGTAQRITASTSVALTAGEYGKLTVSVKTANLSFNESNKGGANVKVTPTIDATELAPYAIYGIKDTEWTTYTIYIKGDKEFVTSYDVQLGLGFGNGKNMTSDFTEGTAYFDNVVFEKIDEADYLSATQSLTATNIEFNSDEKTLVNVNNDKSFAIDMTFDYANGYFNTLDLASSISANYTTSGAGNVGKFNGSSANELTKTTSEYTLQLVKASYTITLTNPAFNVKPNEYCFVSFNLKNNLSSFDRKGITVYVYDDNGVDEKNVTNAITFTEVGEEKLCRLIIKNNFKTGSARPFYLVIVVGPTDVNDRVQDNYATGTVTIQNLQYASGQSTQFEVDSFGNSTDVETENYAVYNFLSNTASNITTLYSGSTEDYTDTSSSETFNLAPALSEFGKIVDYPVNVKGYTGITSDSAFLSTSNTNYLTNTRSANGKDGNFAGLINTKYINGYSADIKTAIGTSLNGLYTAEKNLQPVMIYNKEASSYGFIGSTLTVESNSFAKVSLKVRTIGDAKAFIYLVNVVGDVKNVLELDTFTSNTDGYSYVSNGDEYSNNLFELTVDKNVLGDDDWATVTFYVATGVTEKKFRLEFWNGGRDGSLATASQGMIYVDDIQVSTMEAFVEHTDVEGNTWVNTFTNNESVLYGVVPTEAGLYRQVLTEQEETFNSQYPDSQVSYVSKYVWVKSDKVVYGIFNSIDPIVYNPYNSLPAEPTGSGCTGTVDASTFWMSFSSILLSVALLLALVMLFVKRFILKRKANASDAKSHYKVRSRYSTAKAIKQNKEKTVEDSEETPPTEEEEVVEEEVEILNEETENQPEESDYEYGEVQDFGKDEE